MEKNFKSLLMVIFIAYPISLSGSLFVKAALATKSPAFFKVSCLGSATVGLTNVLYTQCVSDYIKNIRSKTAAALLKKAHNSSAKKDSVVIAL